MGAKQTMDSDMRNLVSEMSEMVQSKSLLQYRISQLKLFNEQKIAYPKISEVKETQLLLINLEKELNDTTNLLDSIQECKEEEHLQALEDTYAKLKNLLEERENEANILEAEVQKEVELHNGLNNELSSLKEEGEKLAFELFKVKESENFRILRKLNEEEEEINRAIKQNEEKKLKLIMNKNEYLSNRSQTKFSNDLKNVVAENSYEGRTHRVPRLRLATIDIEKSYLAKSISKQ